MAFQQQRNNSLPTNSGKYRENNLNVPAGIADIMGKTTREGCMKQRIL